MCLSFYFDQTYGPHYIHLSIVRRVLLGLYFLDLLLTHFWVMLFLLRRFFHSSTSTSNLTSISILCVVFKALWVIFPKKERWWRGWSRPINIIKWCGSLNCSPLIGDISGFSERGQVRLARFEIVADRKKTKEHWCWSRS